MAQFITNQDKLLGNVINDILPTTQRLFMLVGYFYFSGFNEIYREIKEKEIKILIGLDIEKDILNKYREYELITNIDKSRGEIRKNYNENFVSFFNETDFFDSEVKQEAFRIFVEKIKNGTLQIKKTKKPNHSKLYLFETNNELNQNGLMPGTMITGSSNLTRSGLKGQHEINVIFRDDNYNKGKTLFDELWKSAIDIVSENTIDDFLNDVIENIWLDKLPRPFLMYVRVLFEYFSFKNPDKVKLPAEITNNKYFNLKYQTDALKKGLEILNNHNGVIISDVVGLGKSIIASAIAYNLRKKTVIIAPPHLVDQWEDYRYLFDFNAKVFSSGKIEEALKDDLNEERLIIIDEAHKYRNEMTKDYGFLHQLCQGNKVILLTATPFNNRPQDIFSMIKLFQIPAKSTIQTVDNLALQFKSLINEYKKIQKNQKEKSTSELELTKKVNNLSDKIRDILSPILIRRSRIDLEAIEEYRDDLNLQNISFSKVNDPILQEYNLGEISDLYIETLEQISSEDEKKSLIGARYKPVLYLKNFNKYKEKISKEFGNERWFKNAQINLAKFMRHLLVRRFESSVYSFRKTLENMIKSFKIIEDWYERLGKIPIYKNGKLPDVNSLLESIDGELSIELENINFDKQLEKHYEKGLMIIKKNEIRNAFIEDLKKDIKLLQQIKNKWSTISIDPKLNHFKKIIKHQFEKEPNRKIVVFTEFSDTANYLFDNVKDDFRTFKYSSGDATKKNKMIIKENFDASFKGKQKNDFDLLIATDSISEGYNLHRAGTIFNYDIPYNPTRVIQRIGRINRIDKKVFEELFIYNYFPTDIGETETRTKEISTLKIAVIQAILGEDTKILTSDEELKSFYKKQYKKEMGKSEKLSWDAKYLDFYNKLKISNPEVIEEALKIPHRTRIKRTANNQKSGVIVFGRKGNEYTFKFSETGNEVYSISAKNSIELFEAEVTEKAEEVSALFEKIYQKVKDNLFIKKTQIPSDKGKGEAIDKIEILLQILPNQKDYLEDLLNVLKNLDGLPDRYSKLIRAFDEKTLAEDLRKFKIEVPHSYLMKIIKKSNVINEGKEQLILSEEF
jgi:ERCC4-related helicase